MKQLLLSLLVICALHSAKAQLYYPPTVGSTWETTDPATLGWCQDSIDVLYDFLDDTHTKAFILLKDGRIVLERYFGTFTVDSFWVWNSAGKTLTATAVGIAQEEGFLHLDDTTSDYLGAGWTNMTPQQEEKITIRHQLTMTSGLDDTGDLFCTDSNCLDYMAEPGTRWSYHNAPYTLLDGVIANATGMTLNQWITQKIKQPTGMNGFFIPVDYNNIFISTARSMARFGLLLHGEGYWNGTPVLDDPDYFYDMTHSSQSINPAYGYLTWLNGQSSFMIPQSQLSFPGTAMPQAPSDVFAALGKNSQIINVSPSNGIVFIRMGDNDQTSLVSITYNNDIWERLNNLSCPAAIGESSMDDIVLFPNPSEGGTVAIQGLEPGDHVTLTAMTGQPAAVQPVNGKIDTALLPAGVFLITINRSQAVKTLRLLVD